MKFWEVLAKLLIIGTQVEVTGFRYEIFTELPAVKLVPLSAIKPPAGPEVGNTSSVGPKLTVNGLPNPVT